MHLTEHLEKGGDPIGVRPVDRILVTSRDYREYLAMFDLSEVDLRYGRVLECPGGASDFAVTVRGYGGHVVSVDPLYAVATGEMARMVADGIDHGLAKVLEVIGHRNTARLSGMTCYLSRRRSAADRFLADLARDRANARADYVAAALPDLPFADDSFTLALVSNLLFTYGDVFDRQWHLNAIRELARVSPEVRIHPITDPTGQPYAEMDVLRHELARCELDTRVIAAGHRAHGRGEVMLVCLRC